MCDRLFQSSHPKNLVSAVTHIQILLYHSTFTRTIFYLYRASTIKLCTEYAEYSAYNCTKRTFYYITQLSYKRLFHFHRASAKNSCTEYAEYFACSFTQRKFYYITQLSYKQIFYFYRASAMNLCTEYAEYFA